jgi:DNA-binding beta-propeller fold protein YncE
MPTRTTPPSLPARLLPLLAAALLCVPCGALASGSPDGSFVNFESGQVRPLALSPDGRRLFAVNTPDDRLELFDVTASGLVHAGSVPVGLEPVAVAARTDDEVWVVNHLSDSVSIVDVAASPPRVTRTLLTCDEPRDIVFAGPGGNRAFVTAARRGQNCPVDAALTTPGVGRAVVQVWDADTLPLDTTLPGTPLVNLVLFGDTPRALARSADGATVYAAIFESGNETTALNEAVVCDGGAAASACGAFQPGGLPAPNMNVEGIPQREVGLIVRRNPATGHWEDELGRDWSGVVSFELPDLDVFAIDAAATVPVETASFAHVGTILFDIATNPVSGRVYVSNTEARNEVRFEGPGLAFNSTTVQGHLHEARITVLDGMAVLPRHLNKHIDYAERPAPAGVKERSLATPLGMAVTADGATLYVAAFGSDELGIFSTAALEQDTFTPDASAHIALSGGGPTGLVLDEARGRAYVFTRFDNAVSVVDLAGRVEVAHVPVFTPEPAAVVNGRRLLYDAAFTSSNGEASCSSCHVFGDFDSLAWDLGNPDDLVSPNPLPFRIPSPDTDFHPLKGPMTTQSLRGMANHGSMHWRGDRTGGNDPPLFDGFDEDAAFKKFNQAFPGLLGRESELSADEMQAFTDFILTVTYPPNPVRRLNGTLTNAQQLGRDLYFGPITDVVFNCNGCHTLDPGAGFFGTDGFSTFEGETQAFKVPHLRNVYQKVGMFGQPGGAAQGPQVRGFGVLHDGSVDTVFNFLGASVFSLTNAEQRRLQQFVFAFDSNLAPIVGQQVTLTSANAGVGAVTNRLDLMIARDTTAEECEVIVKGTIDGEARGGWLTPAGTFQLDRASDAPLSDADLRLLAATPGQELTYTCAPYGSGRRMGVDRDEDGHLDRDELDAGSDPADAASVPIAPTPIRGSRLSLRDDDTPPVSPDRRRLSFRSAKHAGTSSGVVVPTPDSAGDPTLGGAVLRIYGEGGPGRPGVALSLPAAGWVRLGSATAPRYKYTDRRRERGPITAVTVKGGSLRVKGKGEGLPSLADAPQGTVTLRLQLGGGIMLCASAPAKEPAASNDTTARFNGERHAAPPVTCPPVPAP